MKSIFKLKETPKTNREIFDTIMQIKSVIDCIVEEKGLTDDHDLNNASMHLNRFLDAMEEQGLVK